MGMGMDRQRQLLQKAAEQMRNEYICEEKMLSLLLTQNAEDPKAIETIDCLYRSFQTSMQFCQYRRALRYLIVLQRRCQQTLGSQAMKQRMASLEKELSGAGAK